MNAMSARQASAVHSHYITAYGRVTVAKAGNSDSGEPTSEPRGDKARSESTARVILDQSEQLRLSNIELLPAAVYVCDSAGTIVDYNYRAADLWGRSPKKGDGDERHCGFARRFRLDGSELPRDCSPTAHALATGERSRDVELTVERSDGSRRTLLVNVGPARSAAGGVFSAVTVIQDISAWRQSSEALQQTMLQESLQRLSAEIAHSYCNLFAAISSNLTTARKTMRDGRTLEAMGIIEQIVGKGLSLTNRLLSFAQDPNLILDADVVGALVRPFDPVAAGHDEANSVALDAGDDELSGTVLLVDDDRTMRAVATDALTTLGFDVLGVEHGVGAIEAIRSLPLLRLMVINIDLAPSNSLEVLRNARAIKPSLRALIITGRHDISEDFVDQSGPVAVLRMPFRIQELAHSIGGLMGSTGHRLSRFPSQPQGYPD